MLTQKVKKLVRSHKRSATAIAIVAGIGLVHYAWYSALALESSRIEQSPVTIRSQAQLAQCIAEQRIKLGIDPAIQIDAEYDGAWPSGESKLIGEIGEKHYEISLGGGFACERGVRHELYHIWAGHIGQN